MQNRTLTISLLLILLLFGTIYTIRDILLPFILSIIFGYILNPIVSKISSAPYINRKYASLLVVFVFFLFLAVICITIAPILYKQFLTLSNYIASYNGVINRDYLGSAVDFLDQIFPQFTEHFDSMLKNIAGQIFSISGIITKKAIQSSVSIFNAISGFILTPFITFFLLKDLKSLQQFLTGLLPQKIKKEALDLAEEIDNTLSSYLCGQFYVACVLSCYYTICLYFVGLNSPVAIGIMSGFFVFVPYIGAAFSFTLSSIIAFLQFGTFEACGFIAIVFAAAQFLEGMILTPKLIGDKTGLHPVFIIFFLLLGGNLFGFTGVFFAVPSCAVLIVMMKYFMKKYTTNSG